MDEHSAMAQLRALRKRINDAAEQHGLDLRFEVDSNKRTATAARACWFTGTNPAAAQAAQFSENVTSDVAGRVFENPVA